MCTCFWVCVNEGHACNSMLVEVRRHPCTCLRRLIVSFVCCECQTAWPMHSGCAPVFIPSPHRSSAPGFFYTSVLGIGTQVLSLLHGLCWAVSLACLSLFSCDKAWLCSPGLTRDLSFPASRILGLLVGPSTLSFLFVFAGNELSFSFLDLLLWTDPPVCC